MFSFTGSMRKEARYFDFRTCLQFTGYEKLEDN